MIRALHVSLVFGGAAACMSCMTDSMERVPSADEIRKWPSLAPFVVEAASVTGVYQNIDIDSVVFHYITNVTAEGEFWRTVQRQAASAGWQHVDRVVSTPQLHKYETFQRLKPKGELFFSSAEELRVAYTPARVVVAYMQSDQIGDPEPVSQASESRFADREIWPRFSQLTSGSGAVER